MTVGRRSALAAVVVLALVGCGAQHEPANGIGAAEQLVTRKDVRRYPPGSPERAVMQFWRDAQFANLTAFQSDFQNSVGIRLAQSRGIGRTLGRLADELRTGKPAIVDVARSPTVATVYARIRFRAPVGKRRFTVSSVPQAFLLLKQRGRWRLADDGIVQRFTPAPASPAR